MEDFGSMLKKLEKLSIEPESASLQRIPKTTVSLDEDATRKVLRLIDIIEEDDDVQNVFHTLEISDEMADKL
jgi:transcriptional/translational regulatory protein YebC/TACO1